MAGAEGADSKEQIGNPVDAVAENGHAATGIVANDAGPQEQQQQEQEQPVVLSEFERELKKAKENPSDFNQWVAVEKLLEKEVRSLCQLNLGISSAFLIPAYTWLSTMFVQGTVARASMARRERVVPPGLT